MKGRHLTMILAGLTLLVLVISVPGALLDAFNRGGFHLFSREFFQNIPARLTGPGRFRFILQPAVATILGIRSGLADARAGRPAYLYGLLFHRGLRLELMKSGFESVVNLLLMGVLLDSIFQWVLFGTSYPGAALVVGPVLIVAPYGITRALSNRFYGLWPFAGHGQE